MNVADFVLIVLLVFDIIFPILGGTTSVHDNIMQTPITSNNSSNQRHTLTTQTKRNPQHSHSRQLTKRIVTRQNFTIRIATLNCNGAPKTR